MSAKRSAPRISCTIRFDLDEMAAVDFYRAKGEPYEISRQDWIHDLVVGLTPCRRQPIKPRKST